MLPDDFPSGAYVEAGEVRVERAPALDACGVFVAEGDAGATKRVRDNDLGFGADAHARAREELGGVDFEWLAGIGMVPPCGDEILVGFAHGRNEGAASGMQLRECFVQGVRAVFFEQAVECRNLFADGFRRALVVVALGYCACFAHFFAGEVFALRVARGGDDIVLERLLVGLRSQGTTWGFAEFLCQRVEHCLQDPFAGACECDDVVLREIRLRGALHFASGKKESYAGVSLRSNAISYVGGNIQKK